VGGGKDTSIEKGSLWISSSFLLEGGRKNSGDSRVEKKDLLL